MSGTPQTIRSLLAMWARLWDAPGLEDDLAVRFSHRLKRSLGRCRPASGRVTLRADLRDGPSERLAEVLCHEAAHVVAYRKYGSQVRPHGPEWRGLVTAAGFEPQVRVAAPAPAPAAPPSGPAEEVAGAATPASRRLEYEHRCPVCHTVRYARRPVASWRCAECLDAGLDGEMVITRRSEA